MFWLRASLNLACAALPIATGLWLFRRVAAQRIVSFRRVLLTMLGGGAGALIAAAVERWLIQWTGLSFRVSPGNALSAALAMLLIAAPLEEGLKVAAVWPLKARRRLTTGRMGTFYAVCAAAGFAAGETLLLFWHWGEQDFLDLARSLIALPAHLFFAGLWGYTLGGRDRRRSWFPLVFVLTTLLHGLYDHVVFGRGPALLVVVIPLLITMAFGVWAIVREAAPSSEDRRSRLSMFEPPSVGTVREAMSAHGQPLMLHWIAFGALVTLGVMFFFLVLSVYAGHRWGVDFALIDESDFVATLPLALLGSALLAAFPVSGYLVARASGSRSVLEPAWATGAAIVITLALFSVTDPMALVVAASVAPVGFGLACVGAWFGVTRSE